MVILNLKLNNILSFNNFSINFSYPRKVQNPFIDEEYINYSSSFRYKKLNIFIGSNSSGKTSLMKCIWATIRFITTKEKQVIKDIVNYNNKESSIEIDLVEDNMSLHKLHRIKIKTKNTPECEVLISHNEINLTKTSSYENSVELLNSMNDNFNNYIEVLENMNMDKVGDISLPAIEKYSNKILFPKFVNKEQKQDYKYILENVMKVLDPSISKIARSKDTDNAFIIEYENGKKIIVQQGMELNAIPYLSSGTKYGFNIAHIIFSVKYHLNEIYLIDEQFAYVNSDIEKAIISTIVSLLGKNEQLFITTHNSEVLSLGFPFRSFYFLKKELINNKHLISVNCASEIENRKNVSPKTISDNDIFGQAPKLEGIFKLIEVSNE